MSCNAYKKSKERESCTSFITDQTTSTLQCTGGVLLGIVKVNI